MTPSSTGSSPGVLQIDSPRTSPASALSLGLQGGPCTPDEVAAFERNPFADEAVRLRRWDDVGKIEGLDTPPLSHYRPALRAGLRGATPARR